MEGFTVQGIALELSFEEANRLARGTDYEAALHNTLYDSGGISACPEGERVPHHHVIRGNTVFDLPGAGISSNGSDYVRIERNTVCNNAYYSPFANSGISFYASKAVDDSTRAKMLSRRNIVYGNEYKVARWFSAADPAERFISDGNGIIIDDSLNAENGPPYTGRFVIENNLVFNYGGRGANIFLDENVRVRDNTFYRNGRTKGFSEFHIGWSRNVRFLANVFDVRPDRDTLLYYGSSDVQIRNNLLTGKADDLPAEFQPRNSFSDIAFVTPSVNPLAADFSLRAESRAVDA